MHPPAVSAELKAGRQKVAALLEDLLWSRLTRQQVFNQWPFPQGSDPSLDVVYQALLYFDAGDAAEEHSTTEIFPETLTENLPEDQKQPTSRLKTEPFYVDAQLKLLQQMADFLKSGQALPAPMLNAYAASQSEHQTGYYASRKIFWAPLHRLITQCRAGLQLARHILHSTDPDQPPGND